MTPTSEQVIQWAKAAGFGAYGLGLIEAGAAPEVANLCAIAMGHARAQALDEAAGVCDTVERESHTTIFLGATDEYLDGRAMGANVCKGAIQALKGKQ